MESTATIKLRAVDTNVVTTINNVSTASTNAVLGATALAGGFKLLEKASSTSVAQMAVGANNAQLLTDNFGKLATAGNKVTQVLGKISNAAFITQQIAIAADGVGRAAEQYARLPQAMQAMQASGVSTYTIAQFNTLTEAIRGSDIALDSLLVSSIAELGEFEKAAARAGTILKSSLRFDESGNALTANSKERLDNALAAQKLVNDRLNNSVTSSEALRGQYEVLSSGFTNAAESQEVLEQGLKLIGIGKAGGNAVNTTATLQLLTKTLNAYELQAEDAAKTAAILNATVENGLTTIQELSNGFGATSAQASKANIALVDTAAAVSVLTAQGTSTAESLTGIARVSANIISKTPEAEKELAKLQIRGEKIRFDKAEIQAKGFTQALIDLYDAAGGSSEILTKIFPEDVAYRTVNALLTEQGRRLSSTRDAISGADETKLNEIFEVAQSDRVARFERLANRFKESIIEIGISLAPTLEPGIKALETIADKFAGLPEPVRKAIGSYLAFQIQSKAVGNAAGVLVKTLVSLATNYLLVRTLSLALTGQLGKEAGAIKSLITQKKGLTAATLQLFGIDQKWRLEQTAATAAIAKQGKVAQAAAAAKAKATATVKSGVVAGVAATSGITKEKAVAELNKRKAQAIALAQYSNVKAREYAQQIANRYGFQLPSFEGRRVAGLLPAAGGTSGIYAPPARTPIATPTPVPIVKSRLSGLVASDRAVGDAATEYAKTKAEYDKLVKQKQGLQAATSKAAQNASKAEVALAEAKNKAIAATTGKQEALNEITKKQQKLTQANNVLAVREHELRQVNTAGMVQHNRLIAAQAKLESSRVAAKAKYLPLSKAITIAELREQKAIALSQAAKIAKLKAEQAEIALGSKSKITLLLKRDARLAEIAATKASEVASKKKAVVQALETKLTLAQTLAEKGLYEAKIFGRTVRLSEVGLMGKINKTLTTNILLANAAAVAESRLAKIKAGLLGVTKLLNYQIGIETVKLGAVKGIRTLESAYLLLKAGASKAGSAIAGILSPLGALAPLLGVAAVATIVLRDEFFGLGKDVRKATKDYQEFLKEQDKLNSSIAKRSGLTRIEGLLEVKSQRLSEGVSFRTKVKSELIQLKDSGALTTTEFNKLSKAFDKTAGGGDKATKSLAELRAEIKRVKADAVDVEKGIVSSAIDGVKKTPGFLAKVLESPFVATASAVNSLINPTINRVLNATGVSETLFKTKLNTKMASYGDIQQEREADKIRESISTLQAISTQAGDRYTETTRAIVDYRENLVLTSEVQNKVAQGIKLTSADLATEDAAYKERADKNRSVIDQLEKQIAANKAIADKTKNEDNKQLVENQIQQAVQQKEALEAQNEALKQLQADTKTYLTQTLPAIQTALKENADPVLALNNAQEQFNQTFLTDGEGRVTKLLKPIETLRDEAGKLVGQVQENLAFGLLDNSFAGFAGGEVVAAEKIRAIRDNQISFLENGQLVNGYRLTLGQRRELTTAIIALENEELKRAESRNQIEIDLAKTLQQAQLETASVTNLKLAEYQATAIANRITQKENEIDELRKLGLRTIDQEIQLEQLRVQQQGAGFGLQSAELQAELERDRFLSQKSEVKSQKLIANSQKLVNNIQNENTILGANLNLYQQIFQVQNKTAELSNSISSNEVFNAQVQQKIAIAKIDSYKQTLPKEREQLQMAIAITTQQNKQRLIEAQIREEKAELSKLEATEQFNLARKNRASVEQLDRLKLQVEQADLNLTRAKDATDQAQFQNDLQQDLNNNRLIEFEINKQLERSSNAIAQSRAQLRETEAKITREYTLQNQAIELRASESRVRSSEFNSIVSFRTGELSLAQKVASSEKEKLKIAQQLSALKLRSLKTQIASEAEVLAINQQQAKLQLQAKQSKTGAELEQNVADILKVEANIKKLQAQGASSEAIAAEEAQLQAAIAQRQSLLVRSRSEQDEARLLNLSQAAARRGFARESELKVDSARVEAIGSLPEDQQKRAAQRLFNEFRGKAEVGISQPSITSIVDGLRNFKIEVPDIKIPQIELPSLDDIRNDVRAIVSEFNTNRPPNPSNYLNTYEGEGKKFVIQNLSMDSPINININGEDKEEIAEQVEVVVNNTMGDFFSNLEQDLNNNF